MNSGYLALGVALLLVGILDLLWTTLWVEKGAGPLTSGLTTVTWGSIRRVGRHEPRVLTVAGPVILLVGLGTWLALLWAGWTFVLASTEPALVDTLDRGPISWGDHAYVAGYAIFTLGNGDFVPRTGVPQIVTVLASASGLLLVTLVVTYVLSVLEAVAQKRSFASDVSGLGSDPAEVVRTSWNGSNFDGLGVSLNTLASDLNTLKSNHKAYPVLHYFHSPRSHRAPASRIAVLDEALTLLRFGVADRARPPELVIKPARSSVRNYLGTVGDSFVTAADRTPTPPRLGTLQEAGIPVVPEEEFHASVAGFEERRRTLLGLVESDVRKWPSGDD